MSEEDKKREQIKKKLSKYKIVATNQQQAVSSVSMKDLLLLA